MCAGGAENKLQTLDTGKPSRVRQPPSSSPHGSSSPCLQLLALCSRRIIAPGGRRCRSLVRAPLGEHFSTEVSLLQLIGDPPPEQITKVNGPDNTVAYVFGPDANTGQVARYHLSSPFYRDFSLLFHVQPTTDKAGVLFAITDASQTVIYVGVKLSAVHDRKQQIIFYYTEPGSESSYAAATFSVPSLANEWTRFAISVEDDEVVLYLNCEEFRRVRFERSPDEMELEDGAGLFVAQAGGADPDKYQVSPPQPQITGSNEIRSMKWIGRAGACARVCVFVRERERV
nr:collagen alpha-1(XVIII) chain-like isoform X2 [Chrysemys picta bellii]